MNNIINNSNIVFKPNNNSNDSNNFNDFKPKKQLNTFYQICQFKSKFTKKYQTRKIIFNELGNILKIYEKEYDYQKINDFLKHHRQNKYKMYPSYDITNIDLPSTADIICCQSDLLNGNSNANSNGNSNANSNGNSNGNFDSVGCSNFLNCDQIDNFKISNKFLN